MHWESYYGEQDANRPFARDLLRAVEVGLRLQPGAGRWSVEVVMPIEIQQGWFTQKPSNTGI
jgi:hypothetical protein